MKKDYAGAEEEYRTAIRLDPENAEPHFDPGILLEDVKKDYAGAEEAYRTAIRLYPENATAHNNLGILLGHRDPAVTARSVLLLLPPCYCYRKTNQPSVTRNKR